MKTASDISYRAVKYLGEESEESQVKPRFCLFPKQLVIVQENDTIRSVYFWLRCYALELLFRVTSYLAEFRHKPKPSWDKQTISSSITGIPAPKGQHRGQGKGPQGCLYLALLLHKLPWLTETVLWAHRSFTTAFKSMHNKDAHRAFDTHRFPMLSSWFWISFLLLRWKRRRRTCGASSSPSGDG